MARGFGSTLGVGTTDNIFTNFTGQSTLRSYSIWASKNGGGGANFGRLFEKGSSAAGEREYCSVDEVGGVFRVVIVWSTTAGIWTATYPAAGWHNFVVTYNSGSTANDPIIYIDGVSVAVTEASTPSGSIVASADRYMIGNRDGDLARNWDGRIAEFALWSRILTSSEAQLIGRGWSPLWFRQNLDDYTTLKVNGNLSSELFSGVPIRTGTTVRPTEPIIFYPPKGNGRHAVANPNRNYLTVLGTGA